MQWLQSVDVFFKAGERGFKRKGRGERKEEDAKVRVAQGLFMGIFLEQERALQRD